MIIWSGFGFLVRNLIHDNKKNRRWIVSIKKRSNSEYLYLAKRRNGKVRFGYIGRIDSKKALEIIEQVAFRKDYELKLSQVINDLKEIEKEIHGRKI